MDCMLGEGRENSRPLCGIAGIRNAAAHRPVDKMTFIPILFTALPANGGTEMNETKYSAPLSIASGPDEICVQCRFWMPELALLFDVSVQAERS